MNTMEELVWTRELPKEIGVYWRRHSSDNPKLPVQEKVLSLVIRRDGEFRVNNVREGEFGTPLKWFDPRYTEWCGPLNPNKPKNADICPVCGHPSGSIDCHKQWDEKTLEHERRI